MTPKPFSLIDALDILNPAKAERMRSAACIEAVEKWIAKAQTEADAAKLELPDSALHRALAKEYLNYAEGALREANGHHMMAQRLEGLRT